MSLKLSRLFWDFVEYKALEITIIVPPGSMTWAFPEPSMRFVVPNIVLILASTNFKFNKYL